MITKENIPYRDGFKVHCQCNAVAVYKIKKCFRKCAGMERGTYKADNVY